MNRIYLTGDLHGDLTRLSVSQFPEQKELDKEDYLIVVGDFGVIFDKHKTFSEFRNLHYLNTKPFTTLFLSGNHDNEERLSCYPISIWNGGRVHKISNKVIHLMRGEIYQIGKRDFFCFGGARPHEKACVVLDPKASDYEERKKQLEEQGTFYRVEGENYWEKCTASREEFQSGMENLKKRGYKTDIILSHCAPSSIQRMLYGSDDYLDAQTQYLEQYKSRIQFDKWYFGHYHMDESIDEKFTVLYENIIELDC